MLLRGLIVWLVLMCVAIGNGAFRVAVLVPRFGERAGRVVSTLMLCAEIGLVAWAAIRWIHPGTATRALAVGALWLALTLLFEFGFGRLRGRSWEELMADYHVLRGRIWVLVPATTFVAPYLTAAARGVLGGGSQARSPGRGLRRRDSRSRDSSSIA